MITSSRLWTVADLDTLPDDGGWTRYEIVEGELIVTHAPHFRHQGAASKLHTRLENWSEQTGLGRSFEVPGLIFTRKDAVIPDLIWISHERLSNGTDDAGHFTVAPELIVEVLSPGKLNEERDRDTKLKLYSKHGVQESWIVSWQQQTIEIYRRSGEQLELSSTLSVEDTLSSPLLKGFSTPLTQIFL